jgi:hypothetical protein
MKNQFKLQCFVFFFVTALLAAFVSGCSSCKPGKAGPAGKYTIEVNLDESLKAASVLVHLVGINAGSLPRWQSYSMTKYWDAKDPMRTDADKVELSFASGQSVTQSMDIKHPKWDQWKTKGVTHVLVLADLPGAHIDKEGAQDARRQILALDVCTWPKGTEKLNVLVKRSGIDIITPPRAR